MKNSIDGTALVYCNNKFNTPEGKTAHGLTRFNERFDVLAIIDRNYAGQDAGQVLDGKPNGIPVIRTFDEAVAQFPAKNFVIGLAPDGGRLPKEDKDVVRKAIEKGMNITSGLHDFLTKDPFLVDLAKKHNCTIKDVRKTPDRDDLHFFTSKIEEVDCLKIAVLGTDSAIGKRTTAWIIVHGFRNAGLKAELVGTGQTAWMQGAKYSMIMDSCINDFVSGEIEHATHEAWKNENPDIIVIEGQGSLMNPAYPGGFEILAAGRPDYVVLQHAPKRIEYDGFPGYAIHSLPDQIKAIEVISGKKVIAITVNHENMKAHEIEPACDYIKKVTDLPAFDVLAHGSKGLVVLLKNLLE